MRISDWSSDVCSSDLPEVDDRRIARCPGNAIMLEARARKRRECRRHLRIGIDGPGGGQVAPRALFPAVGLRLEQIEGAGHRQQQDEGDDEQHRSEKRRGGKGCVSTWRSWRTQYPSKKKKAILAPYTPKKEKKT